MIRIVLPAFLSLFSLTISAQEFAVSAEAFNVLYRGVENPVKIAVENFDCDSILVSGEARIRKVRPCRYSIAPGKGRDANIHVWGIRNNDTLKLGTYTYRILQIPEPRAEIGGRSGGKIPISHFISHAGLSANLDDFIFEVEFRVVSFSASIIDSEKIELTMDIEGNRFTPELSQRLKYMRSGETAKFYKIKAIGPDGAVRDLSPISFTIR